MGRDSPGNSLPGLCNERKGRSLAYIIFQLSRAAFKSFEKGKPLGLKAESFAAYILQVFKDDGSSGLTCQHEIPDVAILCHFSPFKTQIWLCVLQGPHGQEPAWVPKAPPLPLSSSHPYFLIHLPHPTSNIPRSAQFSWVPPATLPPIILFVQTSA